MGKKIKHYVKKAGKWAVGLYLGAFLATNAHIAYDYYTSNRPRIERGETIQHLNVSEYKINIGNKEKHLTLVGENHSYNKREHEIGEMLLDKHEHFASEIGNDSSEDMSLGNRIYVTSIIIPLALPFFYNNLGSGRWCDSISDMAKKQGHKVYALENVNDAFNNLSPTEKTKLSGEVVFSMFTAPYAYYTGKNEKPFDANNFSNFEYREPLLDKRDRVMADGIVGLLKKDEIDELLANVGIAHQSGIISNLSKQVKLEEIK